MLGSIAVFERGLIAERVCAGMEAAKQRGKRIGRQRAIPGPDTFRLESMLRDGRSMRSIAKQLHVCSSTVSRTVLAPAHLSDPSERLFLVWRGQDLPPALTAIRSSGARIASGRDRSSAIPFRRRTCSGSWSVQHDGFAGGNRVYTALARRFDPSVVFSVVVPRNDRPVDAEGEDEERRHAIAHQDLSGPLGPIISRRARKPARAAGEPTFSATRRLSGAKVRADGSGVILEIDEVASAKTPRPRAVDKRQLDKGQLASI